MKNLAGDADEISALKAAEEWVYEPTDDHRREALQRVQRSRSNFIGTLAALAAASSGGKLQLNEGPEVELDATTALSETVL